MGCEGGTAIRGFGIGIFVAGPLILGIAFPPTIAAGQVSDACTPSIYSATLSESGQETPELSTDELRQILAAGHAVVLDARPHREFGISHIPGALNVAAKPGVPLAQYVSDVAEIGRLVNQDKSANLVLYCNGPFCGKSKRLSAELVKAGYTHVRRYQLGIPVWRALVGATQIEQDGLMYVLKNDRTAVLIDARDRKDFEAKTIPAAQSLPLAAVKAGKDVGEVEAAKNDGRLPMYDHNTRVVVFGDSMVQARAVAEAIAREAFQNVSFYGGTFEALAQEPEFAQLQAHGH